MERTMVNYGRLIRDKRKELGLTQENVCDGICEQPSYSKIETGIQTPSNEQLKMIFQRLELVLPLKPYFILANARDFEINYLKDEISACNTRGEFERALRNIERLEKICKKTDRLTSQFILRSRLAAGKLDKGSVRPYKTKELQYLLLQAIHVTVPKLNLLHIENSLLGFEEAKIINHLAIAYAESGNVKKSLDIYRQLYCYTKKHYVDMGETASILAMVSYNYSKYLGLEKNYVEAIEVAKFGKDFCIKYGKMGELGHLIFNLACDYHDIGLDDESKSSIREAYYVLRAMERQSSCETIKAYAKENYNMELV